MKIDNHYGNYVVFSAKMSIKEFKGCPERLKKIAQLFESKTKNYPNDVLELSGNPNQKTGLKLYHCTKGLDDHTCSIPDKQATALFKKSDNAIADKFAKLFKIFKRQDKDYEIGNKFINQLLRRDLYKDASNFEMNFWDILVNKGIKDMQISMSRDPVLKNFIMQ